MLFSLQDVVERAGLQAGASEVQNESLHLLLETTFACHAPSTKIELILFSHY